MRHALLLALLLAPAATPAAADPQPVYALHPADVPMTVTVGALALVPELFADRLVRERCPCDRSGVNALDRRAIGNHSAIADRVSDGTLLLAVAAPPLLDLLDVGAGRALYADVVVFAETLVVNGALAEVAKYTVQRPTPRAYAGDPSATSSASGYRSFYSGHTSSTFAALAASAYTLRLRHGEQVWPWLVAAAVGTSVAVERVAAGRHFPTDVLAAAVAGSAVGIAVPKLHARGGARIVPLGLARGVALRWGS